MFDTMAAGMLMLSIKPNNSQHSKTISAIVASLKYKRTSVIDKKTLVWFLLIHFINVLGPLQFYFFLYERKCLAK